MATLHRLLDEVSGRPFYCVEEGASSTAAPAVALLPGLGENRSGHNYLLAELARALGARGFRCFRLDLAGSGDSLLPLDVAIWRRQLEKVDELACDSPELHVVARGSGAFAVRAGHTRGRVLLLRPPLAADWGGAASLAATSQCGLIKPRQGCLSLQEERLLTALGVEARQAGGLVLTRSFLEEAPALAGELSLDWVRIFASCESELAPEGAVVIEATSPLFLKAFDRAAVRRAVESRLGIVAA